MTVIFGTLKDVGGQLAQGAVTVTSLVTRPAHSAAATMITKERHIIRLVDGAFESPELDPGPIRVEISTGGFFESWKVTLPEDGRHDLATLIEARVEYSPPVVGRAVAAAADAAGSARSASESSTQAADAAAAAAADADRAESAAAGVGQVVSDVAQVADAVLRAEAAAERAEASGGGIIVVSSEEEAAALPIGTVYVIAAEVTPGEPDTPEPAPVTIVGTAGENITTDTFTPTIPNATTGDTIIIAANTKAVGGSTLTAPAGFTTITDGYWAGTQRSWVFSGPWSDDLTITADQPLEFAWAAVAVRGSSSVTWGETKDRGTEPAESTTVTAPSVDHGPNDLTIGITFERTSAAETPEQVTVNEGWTIEHYTAQGTNFQTTLIGVGGTGDMVATYPNAQDTNGVGVQVVAHA